MMLGDVQAIDAGLVGGGGEFQALVERGRDRTVRALDVIEDSDLHDVRYALLDGRAPCTIRKTWGRYLRTAGGAPISSRPGDHWGTVVTGLDDGAAPALQAL